MCVIESFICMGMGFPIFWIFTTSNDAQSCLQGFKSSFVLFHGCFGFHYARFGVQLINIALASHRNMSTIGFFPRSAGGSLAFDWLVIFSVSGLIVRFTFVHNAVKLSAGPVARPYQLNIQNLSDDLHLKSDVFGKKKCASFSRMDNNYSGGSMSKNCRNMNLKRKYRS